MHARLVFVLAAMMSVAWPPAWGQQGNGTPRQEPNPYLGERAPGANPLRQGLGSITDCYRGMHPYFGDDYVGKLISGASEATLAQLGDLCKRTGGGYPDIAVPIGPVNVPSDKVCQALAHRQCVPD